MAIIFAMKIKRFQVNARYVLLLAFMLNHPPDVRHRLHRILPSAEEQWRGPLAKPCLGLRFHMQAVAEGLLSLVGSSMTLGDDNAQGCWADRRF